MSIVDPGGGPLTPGDILIIHGDAGSGVAIPDVVTPSMPSTITYNGKTISLELPPHQVNINPYTPRRVNVTLTGAVETLLWPRVMVSVRVGFRPSTTKASRVKCDNVWQWLQRGNTARIVLDTSKNVSTTLNGSAASGNLVIAVNNATGITQGNIYAIVGGPYYQLVYVNSVNSNDVTIADALDVTFPSGSVFRDWLLWDAILHDAEQRSPFEELVATHRQNQFDWVLDFVEVAP